MNLVLNGIPSVLSNKLVAEFLEVKRHYLIGDWGPSQVNGGRFAEAVVRVFQHILGEPITNIGTDIPGREKSRLINKVLSHQVIDDHVRKKVALLIQLLLDFRNNRDSAHLGGFDANNMDTIFVMNAATWVLCELVRVYGGLPMSEAQEIVDGLAVKEYPSILEVEGVPFITRHDLRAKQTVLVLLSKYQRKSADFLFSKAGDTNRSRFDSKLEELEEEKYIGSVNGEYFILPRGIQTVQDQALLQYPHS